MKKILSVLLSVLIVFSVCVTAFAGEEKVPFLLVTGMDVLPLYKDYGTANEEKVWPFNGKTIAKAGAELILPITKFAIDKNSDDFANSVIDALDGAFEYLKCDENGKSIYNIQTPQFPKSMAYYEETYAGEVKDEQGILNAAVQKYGADNVYFFNYDWRLNPLDHADNLNTLIETIKAEKNCDKINVACCSMGGVITMSYIYKYGSESIKNLMLLSTAFQGITAVSDMFSGDICFEKGALIRRVVDLGKGDLTEFLYQTLMYAVDKSGLADKLVGFANGVIEDYKDVIFDNLLKDTFGNMIGLYDFCPAEYYEEAKAYMLDETVNAKIIEQTDEYIYNVQSKAKQLLDSAIEKGMNVYIVCQYNMQALPVSSSSAQNNDLLIDVKYASGGAVCADLDATLPYGYSQQVNDGHNHISPDLVVDASSCMYPDYTWFIKEQAHVDYNIGATTDFIFRLADSDEQLTVFDNENYTQYMIYDYDSNTLEPMNDDYTPEKDYFSLITGIIEKIVRFFKTASTVIFNIIMEEIKL